MTDEEGEMRVGFLTGGAFTETCWGMNAGGRIGRGRVDGDSCQKQSSPSAMRSNPLGAKKLEAKSAVPVAFANRPVPPVTT